MHHCIVTDLKKINFINFIPTIVVGFYKVDKYEEFFQYIEIIKNRFQNIDLIGCSGDSNIYNQVPHVDINGQYMPVFIFLDIKKEAYSLEYITQNDIQKDRLWIYRNDSDYNSIIFCAQDSDEDDVITPILKSTINKHNLFGAIGSGSLFLHDSFFNNGCIIWSINQNFYKLQGKAIHNFEEAGFELSITKTDNKTILEIENEPALDIIEEIMGKLTIEGLNSFDYTFFIADKFSSNENIPLSTLVSIDREKKTLKFFKKIYKGNKLKVAIPLSYKEKEHNFVSLAQDTPNKGIGLIFVCIAFERYWGEMEPVYLMHIIKNSSLDIIGFHSYGEIAPFEHNSSSVLHNQTITLLSITQEDNDDNN